ncbi:transcription initiation factor E subunit alpha [Methanocaldococcus villosus KIN24-T80]|uniref:Transcription factor E n=1 Tax=Methanocaldococcus villosus KIN24-T80 TaxID=1069083 RepID=N6V081_9EURY|nr:transcription factor E [Methanocaldococcus villosus]ENN95718.1 transcription initiation factor E subunit alpha [Methanocaldococcus villosus KIN24-T80]
MKIRKMLNDPLVQEVLFNIFEGDEKGFELIEVLLKKGETTEEELAKELGIKLNYVRKLLYKLYDARLVDYKKWKNEDSNWFYYTWRPTFEKIPYVVKKRVKELITDLENKLKYEKNNMFFYCPKCNIRFTFEEATDLNFLCPGCGNMLEEFDNSKIIKDLEEQIKFLEHELKHNPILNQ